MYSIDHGNPSPEEIRSALREAPLTAIRARYSLPNSLLAETFALGARFSGIVPARAVAHGTTARTAAISANA